MVLTLLSSNNSCIAHKYAIPNTTENKIRVYGFHGTSHKYVSERREVLDKSDKIITIHLGNGCSMTAIKRRVSIDHSLGFALLTDLLWEKRRYRSFHCVLHNTLGYLEAVNNSIAQRKRNAGTYRI
jgi:acetate kinase